MRAPADGTLEAIPAQPGATVHEGELLAILEDADARTEHAALLEEIETAGKRVVTAVVESPSSAVVARAEGERLQARLAFLEQEAEARRVRAPASARVLEIMTDKPGARVAKGEPLLAIGSGDPQAVFHVRAFEFDALRLRVGDTVECRSPALPERTIVGEVASIAAVGVREVPPEILRAAPMGLVPLGPDGRTATEPYFEIRVRLHPRDAEIAGATLFTRLPTVARTTAVVIERRVIRFLNRVKEGAGG